MAQFEVPTPILCSPFEEPKEHWRIHAHEPAERIPGRRKAVYYFRPKGRDAAAEGAGEERELELVNLIRPRLAEWRKAGYPRATRTTLELLQWWRRDGRQHRLFFAQLEAVETIIFLLEAREDLRQGLDVPWDMRPDGSQGFRRYSSKMATGSGKTTVMGMLCAWSILNKVNDRGDARFSDTVLVVCPNVTIRSRLDELKPEHGEASIYRTRDLVPAHLMSALGRGRVLVTNWHVFEKLSVQIGGASSRVLRAGVQETKRETIIVGGKTTTARGSRYLTPEAFEALKAAGEIKVLKGVGDSKYQIESTRFVESDAAMVTRVLGREVGGKQNILVLNDEAHHAYRIVNGEDDAEDEEDAEELAEDEKEATVWVEGLDRIDALRRINFCVDLSATPYFVHAAGERTNQPFPWVVSDFGLADAIESGLVKIPQLALRDASGKTEPGYFNIWNWILRSLTAAQKGGKKGSPKPEAVLKYAITPLTILAGSWQKELERWRDAGRERPPVFIVVCKNTKIAKHVHEWLGGIAKPSGLPECSIEEFRNVNGEQRTIRVDTKVVHETDSGEAKADDTRWMRFMLDTVGKTSWPTDRQGGPIYPEGFEELAQKLDRPLHPPGRDVRCIVSVGMLTEGWDCNTVTHIVGLRPFMSQLLCEQVVGRGLRRASYEPGENDLMPEEVAQVLGVPFEIVPFKAGAKPSIERPKQHRIHALPDRAQLEIRFPRVERYAQSVRTAVTADWNAVPEFEMDPRRIPVEVQMKATLPTNSGRPSIHGPGELSSIDLASFRKGKREQEVEFALAAELAREYAASPGCMLPPHALFPQLHAIVRRYVHSKVKVPPNSDKRDLLLSPWYGWLVERLREALRPDVREGDAPEVPVYEKARPDGSTAEVDYWTRIEPVPVQRSQVNAIVAHSGWEKTATFEIDNHPRVDAFVKNAGLGFAIPYLQDGEPHDYVPDFIIRLKDGLHVVLETKGFDPRKDVKKEAAERWVSAVNADGTKGRWLYALVTDANAVRSALDKATL